MGRRGPRPTPTGVKIAQGETRPSRINALEPLPRNVSPTMPRDMTNSVARATWRHVMREMGESRVITAADAGILRVYCETMARYLRAGSTLDDSGMLLRRDGELVKNPLHQIVRDNTDLLKSLSRELGLTPAARTGMTIEPGPAATGIDDLLGPPSRLRIVGGLDAGGLDAD